MKVIKAVWFVAVSCALIVAAYAFSGTGKKPATAEVRQNKPVVVVANANDQAFVPYLAYYDRHKGPDQFFPLTPDAVAGYKQRMLGLLERYRDTSFETREIYNEIVTRLGFVAYDTAAGTLGVLRERSGEVLFVVVLGEAEFFAGIGKERIGFAYKRGAAYVMAPAISGPDIFMGAIFYHELGHMLLDIKGIFGNTPPRDPVESQQWYEEEVAMKELEGSILNAASNRAFYDLLDDIIHRSGAVGTNGKYSLLHKAVTMEDIVRFEKMFDLEQAGMVIAKMAMTTFRLMLEYRYIDRAYVGQTGPMTQKIARWKYTRDH